MPTVRLVVTNYASDLRSVDVRTRIAFLACDFVWLPLLVANEYGRTFCCCFSSQIEYCVYANLSFSDPTIKYFLEGDAEGQDYQGGRDFDSLKAFVENTLEIKCNIADGEGCTDKENAYIEKMKAKSSEDRIKQVKRLEGMAGDKMKAELKEWLRQRLHILRMLEK